MLRTRRFPTPNRSAERSTTRLSSPKSELAEVSRRRPAPRGGELDKSVHFRRLSRLKCTDT